MNPAKVRRRYRMLVPHFTASEGLRRAKIAALRGDLDRAERWMKLTRMMELAGERQRAQAEAAMRLSADQADRDRVAGRARGG